MATVDNPAPGRPANVVTCAKCRSEWSGLAAAHCAGCHLTFTGINAFEKHRLRGVCLLPSDRGLVLSPNKWFPAWGNPGDDPRWNDE